MAVFPIPMMLGNTRSTSTRGHPVVLLERGKGLCCPSPKIWRDPAHPSLPFVTSVSCICLQATLLAIYLPPVYPVLFPYGHFPGVKGVLFS